MADEPGRGLVGAVVRGTGVALLLLPLLPLRRLFGPIPGTSSLVSPSTWLAGTALAAGAAWLLAVALREKGGRILAERVWKGLEWRALPYVAVGLVAVALFLVAGHLFEGHALHLDSIVQLFQAEIFAGGRLKAAAPADAAFFLTQNTILDATGWYAQYPPGQSALLAIGVKLDAPWTVPIATSLGSAALLYAFTRTIYGSRTAALAVALLAVSPFFWFMGAGFMNHVPTLFFTLLFLLLLATFERHGRLRYLAGAGLALGAAFLTRPLTALAVGAAFSAVGWWRSGRPAPGGAGTTPDDPPAPERPRARESLGRLAVLGCGFLAAASLFLLYNAFTTGDALVPGYLHLWGDGHGLGFHETPWGGRHTPLLGLRNQLADLALLNVHLFEWPIPALWPLAAFLALGWADRRWDRRLLAGLLVIPLAYFFYWHRDDYLGPRFLYASLAFALPLTARVLERLGARLRTTTVRPGGAFPPAGAACWVILLVGISTAWALVGGIPSRARWHAAGRAPLKQELLDDARAAGLDRGLIFVSTSWGNRLIARLRGLGASASLVERAYRTVDHCRLHGTVEAAETVASAGSGPRPAEALNARLTSLIEDAAPVIATAELNGDPSLRVAPERPLSVACRDEILYDRRGYGLYTPHLPANRPGLDGPFIVVRDLRAANVRLRDGFPDLPAYLYRGGELEPLP